MQRNTREVEFVFKYQLDSLRGDWFSVGKPELVPVAMGSEPLLYIDGIGGSSVR